MENLPKFYVGQRIVAIVRHSQGLFKAGDEFVVKNITRGCCTFRVDVGIKNDRKHLGCTICGRLSPAKINCEFNEGCFAPIKEQKFPLIKLTRIIEKELVSAN